MCAPVHGGGVAPGRWVRCQQSTDSTGQAGWLAGWTARRGFGSRCRYSTKQGCPPVVHLPWLREQPQLVCVEVGLAAGGLPWSDGEAVPCQVINSSNHPPAGCAPCLKGGFASFPAAVLGPALILGAVFCVSCHRDARGGAPVQKRSESHS